MVQVAYPYQKNWTDDSPCWVEGHFMQEVATSPQLAQRKANSFLAGYVTMMVSAGQPMLILGDYPMWQVPAILQLPKLGAVSTVGTVEVNAQTGELKLPSTAQIQRMQELAHAITSYFTSAATTTK